MRRDSGLILGWKYGDAEGIVTVDGKITQWPASLGEKPTVAQIDAWGIEYDAAMLAIKQAEDARIAKRLQAILDTLPAWANVKAEIDAIITAAQDATTLNQVRRAVVDLAQFDRKMTKILYWLARDADA